MQKRKIDIAYFSPMSKLLRLEMVCDQYKHFRARLTTLVLLMTDKCTTTSSLELVTARSEIAAGVAREAGAGGDDHAIANQNISIDANLDRGSAVRARSVKNNVDILRIL
jgi:hypothetical protein